LPAFGQQKTRGFTPGLCDIQLTKFNYGSLCGGFNVLNEQVGTVPTALSV